MYQLFKIVEGEDMPENHEGNPAAYWVLGSGDFNHSGSGEKSQSESDEKNQSPRPVN